MNEIDPGGEDLTRVRLFFLRTYLKVILSCYFRVVYSRML